MADPQMHDVGVPVFLCSNAFHPLHPNIPRYVVRPFPVSLS